MPDVQITEQTRVTAEVSVQNGLRSRGTGLLCLTIFSKLFHVILILEVESPRVDGWSRGRHVHDSKAKYTSSYAPQTHIFLVACHISPIMTFIGSRGVARFSPRHSRKSLHRLMSHRNLLGLPDIPPRFPDLLVSELGANCAHPRGGSWFGPTAGQNPPHRF